MLIPARDSNGWFELRWPDASFANGRTAVFGNVTEANLAELDFAGAVWAGFLADVRAAAAGDTDASRGLANSRSALARLQVKRRPSCWLWVGTGADLVAAGKVPADTVWPGQSGTGKAPRRVERADGRNCTISTNPRRKAGANMVLIGMLAAEWLTHEVTE